MVALPKPFCSAYSAIFFCASSQPSPLKGPELMSRESSATKGSSGCLGLSGFGRLVIAARQDDDAHVDAVLLGEFEVALIVRGHAT